MKIYKMYISNLTLQVSPSITPLVITRAATWQNQQNYVRPAKTQISLGIRPAWSVFAVHMKKAKILSFP